MARKLQLAVLDPNATQQDEYSATPVSVMKEVLTINGVTPDTQPGYPDAVREWCINTAAIDPFTKSALVNSEDGVLYRWDFTTNTFTQRLRLTAGRGEAYTPTLVAPDGTVFAINDATLFAAGDYKSPYCWSGLRSGALGGFTASTRTARRFIRASRSASTVTFSPDWKSEALAGLPSRTNLVELVRNIRMVWPSSTSIVRYFLSADLKMPANVATASMFVP